MTNNLIVSRQFILFKKEILRFRKGNKAPKNVVYIIYHCVVQAQ